MWRPASADAGRHIHCTPCVLQMQGATSMVLSAFCRCKAPNPLYSLHFADAGRQIHCTLCVLQMRRVRGESAESRGESAESPRRVRGESAEGRGESAESP